MTSDEMSTEMCLALRDTETEKLHAYSCQYAMRKLYAVGSANRRRTTRKETTLSSHKHSMASNKKKRANAITNTFNQRKRYVTMRAPFVVCSKRAPTRTSFFIHFFLQYSTLLKMHGCIDIAIDWPPCVFTGTWVIHRTHLSPANQMNQRIKHTVYALSK